MNNKVLAGFWRLMIPVPTGLWKKRIAQEGNELEKSLEFMTPAHHDVRNYVVRELPKVGKPLAPKSIATALGIPAEDVGVILDELERHMTFLFRNERGEVTWAYPVTAEKTPHLATFSTGEVINAA